jgi:hypothetical protein
MRIMWALLLLAGCAASPTGANVGADTVPPRAPSPPGPGADAWRAAIEANEAPFHVPGHVTAHLGEEVQIGDVRVTPLAVVEDSRCPSDATCVWAGRVRLRVRIGGAGEQVMEIGHPLTVAGGQRLTLVAVAPLNWARPPAGVDPNAPKRFAFSLSGMD